jgi:hypothetical protein
MQIERYRFKKLRRKLPELRSQLIIISNFRDGGVLNAITDFLDIIHHSVFLLKQDPEIGTSSIDWTHREWEGNIRTDTESSLRNVVLNKNRTMDNVKKGNNYSKSADIQDR